MTVTMHGLFDLKNLQDRAGFASAFDRFCEHLKSKGFTIGWSYGQRIAHAGYDSLPPETRFLVTIEFPDMETADACYAYVAADEEPLRSLHRGINSRIVQTTSRFFMMDTLATGRARSDPAFEAVSS